MFGRNLSLVAVLFSMVGFSLNETVWAKPLPPRGTSPSAPPSAFQDRQTPEELFERAIVMIETGNFREALRLLEQVSEMPRATETQRVEAHFVMAKLFQAEGAVEPAIQHLSIVVRDSAPDDPLRLSAHLDRGMLLMEQQSPLAIEDFSFIIDNPLSDHELFEQALLLRGLVRTFAGDWEGTVLDMDRLLRRSFLTGSVHPAALALRGLARKELGDLSGAVSDLLPAYFDPELHDVLWDSVRNALLDLGIEPDSPLHRT